MNKIKMIVAAADRCAEVSENALKGEFDFLQSTKQDGRVEKVARIRIRRYEGGLGRRGRD